MYLYAINNTKQLDMNFSTFIAKQIRQSDGISNNYQHTHDRVEFDNETRRLTLDEICVNEYGSSYSRNVGFACDVPASVKVPAELSGEGCKWADFDDLPTNYGTRSKTATRPKHR